MTTIQNQVRKRRDREKVIAALRARKFSGEETLEMGIDLCNAALRAAGERIDEEP